MAWNGTIGAYATMGDLEVYLPHQTYNTTSKPAETQVKQMLADIGGELNSLLAGLGYCVPVGGTNANTMRFLREVNALGAGSAAVDAQYGVAGSPTVSEQATRLEVRFQQKLDFLRRGYITLTGATQVSDAMLAKKSQIPQGFPLDADETDEPRMFEIDVKF